MILEQQKRLQMTGVRVLHSSRIVADDSCLNRCEHALISLYQDDLRNHDHIKASHGVIAELNA